MNLDVYLESVASPVGSLSRSPEGQVGFRYLTDALPYPLSLSFPVREEPFGDVATRGFFENLIFENAMRDQVMQRHGIAPHDIVGLLFHLGQDCPGSISVIPAGDAPAKRPGDLSSDYDPLTDDDLADIMRSLRDRRRLPDATRDPSPLAGVQGKVALTCLPDGHFALPRAGAPTTHILKVPRHYDSRLVDHEHTLMGIAADLIPHPVATTEIVGDGDLRGLLIARFDRRIDDGKVHRIHQEDFCQALGFGPLLKYERNGIEGRAMTAAAIGRVLAATEDPAAAREIFLIGTIVNLLLGNTDNHGKNHALLYAGAKPRLAPFYDIVPTLIDDRFTHQISFDIGHARMNDDITADDLQQFARALGIRRLGAPMRRQLADICARVVDLIPTMRGPALKRLGDAMAAQAAPLAAALGADVVVPERDLIVINRP